MRAAFPGATETAQRVNAGLAAVPVVAAPQGFRNSDYSIVGTAFDYRARAYFAPIDVARTVAYGGSFEAVLATADHPRRYIDVLNADTRERSIEIDDELNAEPFRAALERRTQMLARLNSDLAGAHADGKRLDQNEEDTLNRDCTLLAHFETCARAGAPAGAPKTAPIVVALLNGEDRVPDLVQQPWLDDLRALSWLFFDRQHDLLSSSATLNPRFAGSHDAGGADADLIVGTCLIELTTQVRPLAPAKLWQLHAYALLDYDDRYRLDSVGIYLARWGTLIRWSLSEFVSLLGRGWSPDLDVLRRALSETLIIGGRARPLGSSGNDSLETPSDA